MSKINLRVWIVIQALICCTIPLFVYAVLYEKANIMLLSLIELTLGIFQIYVNYRIKEDSDERAREIRAKIDQRIGGSFEGLCVYGGVSLFTLLYWTNGNQEFTVNMLKLIGTILLLSVPIFELIRSVLFVIKDRK